ncbi:MAG: hypothetical protein U0892_04870 [Pirellulales bacterium]
MDRLQAPMYAPRPLYIAVFICLTYLFGLPDARAQQSQPDMGSQRLVQLVEQARRELTAIGLSQPEIALRLKIIENVATVKVYYPHADGGRPEYRNPKLWEENEEGSYVPKKNPERAINDLWKTTSGVRCRKLSALILIKSIYDVSDAKRKGEMNELLVGKVIPNDLDNDGAGTFYVQPDAKNGDAFLTGELSAGDEVWFENPYFDRLSERNQSRYRGQEGHHVFYVGGGRVMDMYEREPHDVEEFRTSFLKWRSVRTVAEDDNVTPTADDFQIKSVRRAILK